MGGDLLRQSAPASVLRPSTSQAELRRQHPAALLNMASPLVGFSAERTPQFARQLIATPPRGIDPNSRNLSRMSREFPRLPAGLPSFHEDYMLDPSSDAESELAYGEAPVSSSGVRPKQQSQSSETPSVRSRPLRRSKTPTYFVGR